jgi:nuclear cap-binding protein subunit 1
VGWASGSKDQVLESGDGTSEAEKMVRQWGERWLRVFRRKFAVEEAWYLEVGKEKVEDVVPEANGGASEVVEMVE